MMQELVVDNTVIALVGYCVSMAVGFLIAKLKSFGKMERARRTIDKCTARALIRDAYEKYVVRGEHLTDARYNELIELFGAYETYGGNGSAKQWMKEIRALKPFLVID